MSILFNFVQNFHQNILHVQMKTLVCRLKSERVWKVSNPSKLNHQRVVMRIQPFPTLSHPALKEILQMSTHLSQHHQHTPMMTMNNQLWIVTCIAHKMRVKRIGK